MKRRILAILLSLISAFGIAQEENKEQSCISYFPLMRGNKTELTISTGKGEAKGKIIYEISKFEELGMRNKSSVSTIYFDDKDQPFYLGELETVCYKNKTKQLTNPECL